MSKQLTYTGDNSRVGRPTLIQSVFFFSKSSKSPVECEISAVSVVLV